MTIEYGDIKININGHPYKGTYSLNNGQTVRAYFFDAKSSPYSPLHAYIMFRDSNEDVRIITGSNEIDDLFKLTTEMTDVPTDELTTTYFQMLVDYIVQESLDIVPPHPGRPIYIEDQIVQAMSKIQRDGKKRN